MRCLLAVVVLGLSGLLVKGDGECPATHPNVYYNGEYCCKSGNMKVYAPQGDECDGSAIKKTSLCCDGDQYVPCPSGNCDSFGAGNILTSDMEVNQNSVGWNGAPERAIDGNTDGRYFQGSCTHSGRHYQNKWQVKMDEVYAISKVRIYNRQDCCQERINEVKVFAGAVFCGEITYEAGKQFYDVDCGGAVAKRIVIRNSYNWLTLCEVQAFGELSPDGVRLKNAADGKPTSQTSIGWGGVPSRAVDGGISGWYPHGTCACSAHAGKNEWSVNLIDSYKVDSVVIFNRRDCCQERLIGAKVYVGDTLCGVIEGISSVYTIGCDNAIGSTATISQDGQYLTLCEVRVLGTPILDLGNFLNIAGDGTATQSSTGWNGVPGRAIDGDISMKYNKESCSHTGAVGGWWNLNFPNSVNVQSVVIYNRKDCCSERINGAEVYADEKLCGTVEYIEDQDVYKIDCVGDDSDPNVFAENVKIMAAANQFLTLCEVKVLSDPTAEGNLAFEKHTMQSSTGWGGVPSRAVDGIESGHYWHNSCTHTVGKGYWMVDLRDTYAVKRVWIQNRVDCCADRINGVEVFVGDVLCGTITYDPAKTSYDVLCNEGNGVVGSTVKINNPNTHLTLCEVKVFGPTDPVVTGEESDEEVTGEASTMADDAKSIASCPVGKVITKCESFTGKVGAGTDGVTIPLTGADCIAHNGWNSGIAVVAKAVCSENEQIADPCQGPALLKYKHFTSKGANPSLECPTGYQAILCDAHSYWWNLLTNKGIFETGVIPADHPCAIPNCQDAKPCDVSLVCKLTDDMESYAASMCPDCEGYHCQEGFECQMIDEAPTCVEKQTGCDIDKCGDHGECTPVGSSDYTCDCEEGFEFDERAGTCLPVHSHYQTVYGDAALGEHAHSYATCHSGQRVMRCHTFGAPSAANGVSISEPEDGVSRCVAKASHSVNFPIMAVAYCGDDSQVIDHCTQKQIHQVQYRSNTGLSPSVSCPDGFVMESCIFLSDWSQSLTAENRARINSIGAVDINGDGTCSMTDCLTDPHDHQWCKLTAVCKKLTGAEYIKAACPTCENVMCGEGMECKMVEDLPQCVIRIPGGCEVDKCGEGECVEDGPDYECLCHTGYRFDGETCLDIDECAEEPCGNGECTNTPGSYSCVCDSGYELALGTCEDINECLESPCSDTERCSNVEGSYLCDCLDTFVKDIASGECVCADGFENIDGACDDMDECADSPCGENEDCINTVGDYSCECMEGTERGQDGSCQTIPQKCDIKAARSSIKAMKGTNVAVKLKGESKKTFKKYATITWTKDNEPWNPKSEGKERINGFLIRKFDANDAGVYVGTIFIDVDGEISKCEVEVEIELLEGSATLTIANEEKLMVPQKAGKALAIICDLDLINVKLADPKSPDNVNWYKVTDDGDVLLDDTDSISIERTKGRYVLKFSSPTADDSGTYRCEFDQQGVDAFTDVTLQVVDNKIQMA